MPWQRRVPKKCPRRPHHLRTSKMAPRTRSKARVEATPTSLFEGLNDDLQNMIVWATTEGGLAKPAAALRGVNKKLRAMVEATRTWHSEWVDAWMELDARRGSREASIGLREGRHQSIDKMIEYLTDVIEWQVDQGWPRKQAEAYTLISCVLLCRSPPPCAIGRIPIHAVRARSDRYAASTQVVCGVLAQLAKQMTSPRRSSTRT